jgi:hypothetical protein
MLGDLFKLGVVGVGGYLLSRAADRPCLVGDGINISELVIANLVAVAPSVFEYWAVWED